MLIDFIALVKGKSARNYIIYLPFYILDFHGFLIALLTPFRAIIKRWDLLDRGRGICRIAPPPFPEKNSPLLPVTSDFYL